MPQPQAGKITEEEAQELIDQFVMKLRIVRQLRTPEYDQLFAGDPTWVSAQQKRGWDRAGMWRHVRAKSPSRCMLRLLCCVTVRSMLCSLPAGSPPSPCLKQVTAVLGGTDENGKHMVRVWMGLAEL